MTDRITDRISRRDVLKTVAVSGTIGLAGCDTTSESTPTPGPTEIPSKEYGINEWGQMLNAHAEEANIDWQQFEGDDIELTFGMGLHPYSTTFSTQAPDGTMVKDYFEELTGITVNYEIVSEDQFWLETEAALSSDENPYDGIMNGLWPAGGYHYGDGDGSWVRDLNEFIENASLTDQDWLAMDDFREQTIELMSFPNEDGVVEFTGFPNGIETYGADWIDRDEKVATLNSEEGIAALEQFGGMLHNYGPANPSTYDWYSNNNAYSEGRVGMMYSTPQTSGIVDTEVMENTKWIPPLPGPDGQEPVSDTWVWSTGITVTSPNPEAAWLYVQWANSRMANLLLSTRQWEGDGPRAGYARLDYVEEQINQGNAPPVPGEGYLETFRQGMNAVPGGNPDRPDEYPPVPVDTPQNMNIMSEVAQAMSSVIANGPENAESELNAIAPQVTEYAKRIPDRYVAADRFLR